MIFKVVVSTTFYRNNRFISLTLRIYHVDTYVWTSVPALLSIDKGTFSMIQAISSKINLKNCALEMPVFPNENTECWEEPAHL